MIFTEKNCYARIHSQDAETLQRQILQQTQTTFTRYFLIAKSRVLAS